MREKYVNWTMPMVRDLKSLTEARMMDKYSLSAKQVRAAMYRYGAKIKSRKNTKWTDTMVKDLKLMTNNQFCEKYGMNYDNVKSARRRYGIACDSENHVRGPRYSAEDVARIFEMRTLGKSWD